MSEKRKPDFRLDFNCFASFGNRIEASFIIDPSFEIESISDMRHSEDTARVFTLVFKRSEPHQLGRRIFTLKKEFEQTSDGGVTLDTSVSQGEMKK